MSAYAPNPQGSAEPVYASLTAGLLARKGEALPAVDADAHVGVDMHMAAPTDKIVQSIRREHGAAQPASSMQEQMVSQKNHSLNSTHPAVLGANMDQSTTATDTKVPDMWTTSSQRTIKTAGHEPTAHSTKPRKPQRKASISFRMPAQDFIRLRFASRELGMSCQSIILEALDCYLDANDVVPVSDEDCQSEVARLMAKNK